MAGRAPRTLTLPNQTQQPQNASRSKYRILIIEARFNEAIADELAAGAIAEIEASGASYERISVPGALEIPLALAGAVSSGLIPLGAPSARYAGAVALGCVIRGDTYHFEIVSNNSNHWLMEVATRHCVPLGNGILTVDTEEQAMERAKGGRAGKGADAVRACLRLLDLTRQMQGQGA
ncbi:MAG: 6,7-dimethyl-8-ribityllumazine synthase [Hyphomicrobiaceae bacterium]